MRILHLIHSEGIYGAELVLLYLAREQRQRGHDVAVGSIRDPGTTQTDFERLAQAWAVPVVPMRVAPRPTPGVVRALLRGVRDFYPDVLHSHGYKANILLGPLGRSVRGPMLATLHGWTGAPPLSALWLYERLDRWAIGRLDAAVVVTRSMLELPPVRSLPQGRKHVIENGIPPRASRMADLQALGARDVPAALTQFVQQRPTLVAIGRLSTEKGFALLVAAFAEASASSARRHQLLIAGEGPQRTALARQIVDLGLQDAVRLGGYVAGADRLLSGAAGFVMSSLTEGMPLVLMEALQWPVPVLATSVGAIPGMLQEGRAGRLVAPNDPVALCAALVELMSASGRPAAEVPESVTERYSSARMAQDYQRVYESIA